MRERKVVYVVMSADIVHHGHINILKIARELANNIGGKVVLGLLTDSAIASYKRVPYMNFEQRKAIVESLKYIDKVIPQETLSYEKNIRMLQPRYVVHGDDWKSGIQQQTRQNVLDVLHELQCGELIEPQYTPNISSTILNTKVRQEKISTEERVKNLSHLFSSTTRLKILNIFSISSAQIGNHCMEFDLFYFDEELAQYDRGGSISLDEKISIIERVCDFSNKSFICDLTFTDLHNTIQAIQRFERIGVSGIILHGLVDAKEWKEYYQKLKISQISDRFYIFIFSQNIVVDSHEIDGYVIHTTGRERVIYLKQKFHNTVMQEKQTEYIIDHGKIFVDMYGRSICGKEEGDIKLILDFFKMRKYEKL